MSEEQEQSLLLSSKLKLGWRDDFEELNQLGANIGGKRDV